MSRILMAENSIITGNASRVGGHQYAKLFSENGEDVFYLSPPVSPFHIFNVRNKEHTRNRFKIWGKGGVRINSHLEEYVPFSFCPLKEYPLLNSKFFVNHALTYTLPNIKKVIAEKGFLKVDVLFISELYFYQLVEFIKYKILVYRKTDDYQYFDGYPKSLLEKEKEMINRADVVFATAKKLKKDLEILYGKKVNYLPNGVESTRFSQNNLSLPQEYNYIAKPRIVYVGTIGTWFDKSLLKFCASHNPKLNFIVIGSPNADLLDLKSYKNIYLLGRVPYEKVPSYLTNADVGIIPFKRSPLSQSINPVKLYEYLAAGLPVVSSFLEDIKESKNIVFLARNKVEFNRFLSRALKEKDSMRYKAIAQQNTWEARFKEMREIINDAKNKMPRDDFL